MPLGKTENQLYLNKTNFINNKNSEPQGEAHAELMLWFCYGFTLLPNWKILTWLDISKIRKRNLQFRASLVAQWYRICLPMQEAQVWFLVWEDSTCRRVTKLVHHNYWLCFRGQELQLLNPCAAVTEVCVPWACTPQEKPLQWEAQARQLESSPHSFQLEKMPLQQWKPSTLIHK